MNRRLLEIMRCPRCGSRQLDVDMRDGDGETVVGGRLECPQGHAFPIAGGVLDLLGGTDTESSGTYDRVWDAHVQQSYAGREDEYVQKFEYESGLAGGVEDRFRGKLVLDAGCGEGRFTFLASALGAEHVVAVDTSARALARAVKGTGSPANCSFVRASILELPFVGEFDYAISLSVLHHTPNTKEAFDRVAAHVRPGGLLSVYVFQRGSLSRVYRLLRPLTLRLDPDRVMRASAKLGFAYDPATPTVVDLRRTFRRLGRADVLGIRHVSAEGLITPYVREHRSKEVLGWFHAAGFEVLGWNENMSVTGRRITS